jgi:addiction module HigA family antidote
MEPYGLTPQTLADPLGVNRATVAAILNERRGMTAEMALRLESVFGVPPGFWLNVQQKVDVWDALHDRETKRAIARLKRLTTPPIAEEVP